MKEEYLLYPADYFTATIYEWKPVLANDNYKDIIIGSLQFLVNKKRIELNGFVIMNNHIHLTCLPSGRSGKPYKILHHHKSDSYRIRPLS